MTASRMNGAGQTRDPAGPAILATAVGRLQGVGRAIACESGVNARSDALGCAVEIVPWCTSTGWRAAELLAWAVGRVPGTSLELVASGPTPTGRPWLLLTAATPAAGLRLTQIVKVLAPGGSRVAVQTIQGMLPCPGWAPPCSAAIAHEQLMAELTRQLDHELEAWRRKELTRQLARLADFRIPRRATEPQAMPARLRQHVESLRRLLATIQGVGLASEAHRLQTLGRVLRLLGAIRARFMRPWLPHRKGCSERLAGLQVDRLTAPPCNGTRSLGTESAP